MRVCVRVSGEGSTGDVLTAAQFPGAEYMRASFQWRREQSINQLSFTQGVMETSREANERAASRLLAGVRVGKEGWERRTSRLGRTAHIS